MSEALMMVTGSTFVPPVQSPGLVRDAVLGPALEIKFEVSVMQADDLENWARRYLTPDCYGSNGTYGTTSLYCDTPYFDVYFKSPGYKRSKQRLRRYDTTPTIFLERKMKKGDHVRKKRAEVQEHELQRFAAGEVEPTHPSAWFFARLQRKQLQPTCRVAYRRTAFFGESDGMPIRMTFDRDLIGSKAEGWDVSLLRDGIPLMPGGALVELKFHIHMPSLFQGLLPSLPAQSARMSKYRRCVELCGLMPRQSRESA